MTTTLMASRDSHTKEMDQFQSMSSIRTRVASPLDSLDASKPHDNYSPKIQPSQVKPRQHSLPATFTARRSVSGDLIASPPRPSSSPGSVASSSASSLHGDSLVRPMITTTQAAGDQPSSSSSVLRLPPILQVEKQEVTTTATQAASAKRRRNEASFQCPVPGCGSTFTRRFNLNGHLRSHTSERPYICEWPGCQKGFARQHDCKRHYKLHSAKAGTHMCQGCGRFFSRMDALNRHLRSETGAECRARYQARKAGAAGSSSVTVPSASNRGEASDEELTTDETASSRAPSVT